MSLRTLCLVLLLSSTVSIGCSMTGKNGSNRTLSTWSWMPQGEKDWTEVESDEHAYVGEMARGNRPKEHDPDPWFQKYFMSEKARDIESNLGIARP